MPRFDATALSIAFATLALASSAAAQSGFRPLPQLPNLDPWLLTKRAGEADVEPAAPVDPASGELTTTIDARIFVSASRDSNLEGGGSVATQSGGWAAALGKRLDGERVVALELSAEAHFYDFSGANVLSPTNNQPFNDLYRAALCGQIHTQIDRRIAYFAGVELELAGEDGASVNDSLSVGALGGVTVTSSEHLSVSLGLAALSQLEDDPWIWPWLGFEWRANDWLELDARGTEFEARAKLGSSWTALTRVDYTLRQFRLSDDDPLSGGAFRDEDIRAGLGLEWKADDGVQLSLLGGVSLWRELATFDTAGNRTENEVDPAPFVAFTFSMSL
jgi:hypothetical protein